MMVVLCCVLFHSISLTNLRTLTGNLCIASFLPSKIFIQSSLVSGDLTKININTVEFNEFKLNLT